MRQTYGIQEGRRENTKETAKKLISDIAYHLHAATESLEGGNKLYTRTCLKDAQRCLNELRDQVRKE